MEYPPVHLSIAVTNRCNFTCDYCLRGKPTNDDIDPNLLKKIFKNASDYGIQNVSLTGGEPLLHPKFSKILRTISKYDLDYSFVTNGSFLSDYKKLMRRIKKPLHASVSLNGSEKFIHDKSRPGTKSWQNAISSISMLVGMGITTFVGFVVDNNNRGDIGWTVKMAKELGVEALWLLSYVPNKGFEYTSYTMQEREDIINELIEYGCKYNLKVHCSSSFLDLRQVTCEFMANPVPYIQPTGEVSFCCNLESKGVILGDLNNDKYRDILELFDSESAALMQAKETFLADPVDKSNCEFCYDFFKDRISYFESE